MVSLAINITCYYPELLANGSMPSISLISRNCELDGMSLGGDKFGNSQMDDNKSEILASIRSGLPDSINGKDAIK